LIDFSVPTATAANAAVCGSAGKGMVIGTTGFDSDQKTQIDTVASSVPVCMASNFSTGVNLCFKLIDMAARVLGDDVDIEIVEAHHRHKVDAPSGTALRLGEAAADGAKRNLKKNAIYHREGTMPVRNISDIGFSTIRGGDIVGDHTVLFAGDGERIELTHRASSRATFAKGALRAAKFLSNHDQGLFDMADVLKIK